MSSETPSWWSNPLAEDPDLSITLEAPMSHAEGAAGAVAEGAVLVDASNKDAGKAATAVKQSPVKGRLSNVSKPALEFGGAVLLRDPRNLLPKVAVKHSRLLQVLLIRLRNCSAPAGLCAPLGPGVFAPKTPGQNGAHKPADTSKVADVSLQGWFVEQHQNVPAVTQTTVTERSKVAGVSFDCWAADKAKTPGTVTACSGSRVSFALNAGEPVLADTPVFAGAAAGIATPAMSMAGSCSLSGVTPGSTVSTAAAAADAAQCSVRGAFVSRGAATRRPRSSVPAAPKFDGSTAAPAAAVAAAAAIVPDEEVGEHGAGADPRDIKPAAEIPPTSPEHGKSTNPHTKHSPKPKPSLKPSQRPRSGTSVSSVCGKAASEAAAAGPTSLSGAARSAGTAPKSPKKAVIRAAAKMPSRIPGPPRSPVGAKRGEEGTAAGASGVAGASGRSRNRTPPPAHVAVNQTRSKAPPQQAVAAVSAKARNEKTTTSAAAGPAAAAVAQEKMPVAAAAAATAVPAAPSVPTAPNNRARNFAVWLSVTGASLHSPGVNMPVQRRSPRRGAADGVNAIAATLAAAAPDAAAPAADSGAVKVPTDPVLTEHHGPRPRTGVKAVALPRGSGAASGSVDTAGLSKSLFASEDGAVAAADLHQEVAKGAVELQDAAGAAGVAEHTAASAESPTEVAAASPKKSPSQTSPLPKGPSTSVPAAEQDKEFSFGVVAAAGTAASPASVGGRHWGRTVKTAAVSGTISGRPARKSATISAGVPAAAAASEAPAVSFSFGNQVAASPGDTAVMGSVRIGPAGSGAPAGTAAATAALSEAAGSISFAGMAIRTSATAKTPASKSPSFAAYVAAANSPSVAAGAAPVKSPSFALNGTSPAVKSPSFAFGVAGAASATPAAITATAVTSAGGVSVHYGRFAPLMGAPSNMTTPKPALDSGVTGEQSFTFPAASQATVGRLAGAIVKAASVVRSSAPLAAAGTSTTPTGPQAATPQSVAEGLASGAQTSRPSSTTPAAGAAAAAEHSPVAVAAGASPVAASTAPRAPKSTPAAAASRSATAAPGAAAGAASGQGTPSVLMSVASKLAMLAASAEAAGEVAAFGSPVLVLTSPAGLPAGGAAAARFEPEALAEEVEQLQLASSGPASADIAPLNNLANELAALVASAAAVAAAAAIPLPPSPAPTAATEETAAAQPGEAVDHLAVGDSRRTSGAADQPADTVEHEESAALHEGVTGFSCFEDLPTPPPPLRSLADELAEWQAAGIISTGNTPTPVAAASGVQTEPTTAATPSATAAYLGAMMTAALDQAQCLMANNSPAATAVAEAAGIEAQQPVDTAPEVAGAVAQDTFVNGCQRRSSTPQNRSTPSGRSTTPRSDRRSTPVNPTAGVEAAAAPAAQGTAVSTADPIDSEMADTEQPATEAKAPAASFVQQGDLAAAVVVPPPGNLGTSTPANAPVACLELVEAAGVAADGGVLLAAAGGEQDMEVDAAAEGQQIEEQTSVAASEATVVEPVVPIEEPKATPAAVAAPAAAHTSTPRAVKLHLTAADAIEGQLVSVKLLLSTPPAAAAAVADEGHVGDGEVAAAAVGENDTTAPLNLEAAAEAGPSADLKQSKKTSKGKRAARGKAAASKQAAIAAADDEQGAEEPAVHVEPAAAAAVADAEESGVAPEHDKERRNAGKRKRAAVATPVAAAEPVSAAADESTAGAEEAAAVLHAEPPKAKRGSRRPDAAPAKKTVTVTAEEAGGTAAIPVVEGRQCAEDARDGAASAAAEPRQTAGKKRSIRRGRFAEKPLPESAAVAVEPTSTAAEATVEPAAAAEAQVDADKGKRSHIQFADDAGGRLEEFQECPAHLLLTPVPEPKARRGRSAGAATAKAMKPAAGADRPGTGSRAAASVELAAAAAVNEEEAEPKACKSRASKAAAAAANNAVAAGQNTEQVKEKGRGKKGAAAAEPAADVPPEQQQEQQQVDGPKKTRRGARKAPADMTAPTTAAAGADEPAEPEPQQQEVPKKPKRGGKRTAADAVASHAPAVNAADRAETDDEVQHEPAVPASKGRKASSKAAAAQQAAAAVEEKAADPPLKATRKRAAAAVSIEPAAAEAAPAVKKAKRGAAAFGGTDAAEESAKRSSKRRAAASVDADQKHEQVTAVDAALPAADEQDLFEAAAPVVRSRVKASSRVKPAAAVQDEGQPQPVAKPSGRVPRGKAARPSAGGAERADTAAAADAAAAKPKRGRAAVAAETEGAAELTAAVDQPRTKKRTASGSRKEKGQETQQEEGEGEHAVEVSVAKRAKRGAAPSSAAAAAPGVAPSRRRPATSAQRTRAAAGQAAAVKSGGRATRSRK